MHYTKGFLKGAVCSAVILSVGFPVSSQNVLSTTMGRQTDLAGLAVAFDESNTNDLTKQSLREIVATPVTASSITVSGSAISVPDVDTEKKTPAKKKKTSKYKNIGISTARDYVCIRNKPSTSGKIVGKLHKGSAATITKQGKQWVKVTSGSVTGYIKKEFLAIGEKAEKLAPKYKVKKAIVDTETLNVRSSKNTKSSIVTQVAGGDSYSVVKEDKKWVKIKADGETGYVSKDYVNVKGVLKRAVAVKEPVIVSSIGTRGTSNSPASSHSISRSAGSSSSSSYSSTGSAIANYAMQFIGNPYVYGGTSLTNGTDCSGFTQAVMRRFGVSIPRDSRSQSGAGTSIRVSDARAGDLIFYSRNGRINHVALCIGGGRVISASSPSTGIRVSNLYYRTPVAARRVV